MVVDVYITGASGMLGFETLRAFNPQPTIHVLGVTTRALLDLTLPQRIVPCVFDANWYDPENQHSTIVHFAGLSNPRAQFDSFEQLSERQIVPHVAMVEKLVQRGWLGHFIYISSGGTIYGDNNSQLISESQPPRPKGYYALQKLCVENALLFLAKTCGFRLTILRVSNPYGSLLPKTGQGVIPILFECAFSGQPFTMFGDGKACRDYLYISDFCAAVRRACIVKQKAQVNTINIASGTGTSLNELIELVSARTGRPINRIRSDELYDVTSSILDNRLAWELLGWSPSVPIMDGLDMYARGYCQLNGFSSRS